MTNAQALSSFILKLTHRLCGQKNAYLYNALVCSVSTIDEASIKFLLFFTHVTNPTAYTLVTEERDDMAAVQDVRTEIYASPSE